MNISILTLFPDIFAPLQESILKRAQQQSHIHISYINMRDFATDKHKSVDDHPYGGGAGMILRVDIVDAAISYAKQQFPSLPAHVILTDPQGSIFTQQKAQTLSHQKHLIIVCGHYEGVDERVRSLVDEEISIGNFILSGGEIPAMAIVDGVARLIGGVLHDPASPIDETLTIHHPKTQNAESLLEYPQYTKPVEYKGMNVPEILLTGDHTKIANWRYEQAKTKTKNKRPDLLEV